jgi:hypothetical protein
LKLLCDSMRSRAASKTSSTCGQYPARMHSAGRSSHQLSARHLLDAARRCPSQLHSRARPTLPRTQVRRRCGGPLSNLPAETPPF